jgi:hypothetical protein
MEKQDEMASERRRRSSGSGGSSVERDDRLMARTGSSENGDTYSESGTAMGLSTRSESPRSRRRKKQQKAELVGLREIYTLEFKKGDNPRKFIMHLPVEIKPGELIENIGGEHMSVRIPDDITPGEKVILVASYPNKDEIASTQQQHTVCNDLSCASPVQCKQS